jgi:glycyl-tRNA synthetase beta chain
MNQDLLLEIGTEEIPAAYLAPAAHQLSNDLTGVLTRNRITYEAVRTFFTPRRLAISVVEVSDHQESAVIEVTGPPTKVAFDDQGNPTAAAHGFARSQAVDVSDLQAKEGPRGTFVVCQRRDEGRPTVDVLAEALPDLIAGLEFPKSMHWSVQTDRGWQDSGIRFARPIRWIVAILSGAIIPIELAGVKSSNRTRGHRLMKPNDYPLVEAGDYERMLRGLKVIVDPERRRRRIKSAIDRIAREHGLTCVPDEDLLLEVTNLVEWPSVAMGRLDERFLDLPAQVVITALREHQRYFALIDQQGQLAPRFLVVLNCAPRDRVLSVRGNERIVNARLEDARFYWESDRRVRLAGRVDELKGVVWQEDLGSLYEKTLRNIALAAFLIKQAAPDQMQMAVRAALLAKADLVTEMVRDGKEFTKLQGAMGREYALDSGEPPEVAHAIYEHYLPRFPGDELPQSAAGACVALADRIDTIAGNFLVGTVPSGSQDPLGLRRQANGFLSIILNRRWHLSLNGLIQHAVALFTRRDLLGDTLSELSASKTLLPELSGIEPTGSTLSHLSHKEREKAIEEMLAFFRGRMDRLLEEEGVRYDIADAILAVALDDVTDARERARALSRLRESPEFERLVIGQKRVANILKGQSPPEQAEISLLQEKEEKALCKAARELSPVFHQAMVGKIYPKALTLLLSLRGPIDDLFDHVLVMDPNPELRDNRLALLNEISHLFRTMADFSLIVIEGT